MSASAEPNLDDSDDEQVSGERRLDVIADDSDSAVEPDDDIQPGHADVETTSEVEEEERAKKESWFAKILDCLEAVIGEFSPRWRNLMQRGMSGLTLISGFTILVYLGPIGLLFLTFLVLTCSFNEVMRLGYKVCGVPKLQGLCKALFCLQHYYLYGQDVLKYLLKDELIINLGVSAPLRALLSTHDFVSFAAYLALLVKFVLSLDTEYIRSYALFAWVHVCLFLVGVPGRMMNVSMLEGGLIFYVLPMTLITLNDIMAYYVGFFFGRTPLIRLSPKKTYEGFIGGGLLTLIFGTWISVWMASKAFLVCPAQVQSVSQAVFALKHFPTTSVMFTVPDECVRNPAFVNTDYNIFGSTFSVMPFALHGFIIALICSTIGPFGGFFASGFKRACKRKNFGNLIPGHGGVTDRCDCMFLCAAIIHVYYNTFIKT